MNDQETERKREVQVGPGEWRDAVFCNNCGANNLVEQYSDECPDCGAVGMLSWQADESDRKATR